MSTSAVSPAVRIRRATPEDAPVCGRILYDAFTTINASHNFPPEFPSAEVGIHVHSMLFSHPGFYSVVAEQNGRIVGSNSLDERNIVSGVGPITVDPAAQNAGIGRQLMMAVLDRAQSRSVPAIRLLQAAFHARSLCLYSKLGFDAREPVSLMTGRPSATVADAHVRPAAEEDAEACNRLCEYIHGHTRNGELRDSMARGEARVVERGGRITGYAAGYGYFGHSVAESNTDLKALLAAVETVPGPGLLIPTRNAELFRWCLESGMRVFMPLTLMSIGLYNEPRGAWLPSIYY